RGGGGAQPGMLEVDKGGSHGVVDDHVTEDLAGCRATKHGGAFEVVAQLAHEIPFLHQRSGAEDEHGTLPPGFAIRQMRPPPVTLGPLVLSRFHGCFLPSSVRNSNAL